MTKIRVQDLEPFDLRIGHMTIHVLPMTDQLGRKLDAEGCYIEKNFTIFVRHRTSPAEQARILLHEILHACYDAGGWGDEARDQESICGLLDRALATLFLDNPHLLPIIAMALHHGTSIFSSKAQATGS